MKITLTILLCFILFLKIQAQNDNDLIIKDINILTLTNSDVMNNKSILIQHGKIVKIDDFKKLARNKNTRIVQGKGKYIMPGLAEMHCHLPIESKVDTLLIENVAAGVTRLRIMNSETPQLPLKDRLNNNRDIISPKLYYSHIINRDIKYTKTQFDSLMTEIKKNEIDFIKLFSVASEEVFDNLMKSANKNSVIVCGHYPNGIKIEKVLKTGFKSIEHLAGYEQIINQIELAKAINQTKESGVFNCPTLDWDIMAADLQYPEEYKKRLVYYNAPKKYLEKWEKDYNDKVEKEGIERTVSSKLQYLQHFTFKQKILKMLAENNCLLLLGSDPGNNFQMNGFNMFEEMYNWSKAGVDNFTILKSATITPAIFFDEDKIWGTVEIGKSADLIILEKNPVDDIRNIKTVEMTIIDGKIYIKKELLNKLYNSI
jgi:imidazolonepropionase-like amidohydrolase